jgi:hypothetical protein
LVEANKQLTQGAFARTTLSKNERCLSCRKEERYVADHDFF